MKALRVPRQFTGLSPLLAAGSRLLALGAIAAGLTPQVVSAQEAQCHLGNATMNGAYVISGTGTVAGVGPIAVIGEVIYNGMEPGQW